MVNDDKIYRRPLTPEVSELRDIYFMGQRTAFRPQYPFEVRDLRLDKTGMGKE